MIYSVCVDCGNVYGCHDREKIVCGNCNECKIDFHTWHPSHGFCDVCSEIRMKQKRLRFITSKGILLD